MNFDRFYRSTVLKIAGNANIRQFIEKRAWKLASRFVAGEDLTSAIKAVSELQQKNVHSILDLLGEMVTSEEAANDFTSRIIEDLQGFAKTEYSGYFSLKLSQLGLDLDENFTYGNLLKILEVAQSLNIFIRIDMEDYQRLEKTITLFKRARSITENVGLVLQSYLKRSEDDLKDLSFLQPNLRIVKGAYNEPADIAYQDRKSIDSAYRRLVYKSLAYGNHTAIATHDGAIIEDVKEFVAKNAIPWNKFEFQMLYGIRRDLQQSLAAEGYTVRAYIPYGHDWYGYFSRRIAERPANLLFVLRGLLGN